MNKPRTYRIAEPGEILPEIDYDQLSPGWKVWYDAYHGAPAHSNKETFIDKIEKIKEPDEDDTYDEILGDLNNLIGLKDVKKDVRQLASLIKMHKQKRSHGIKASTPNLHIVFSGSPGTGKTTVAQIIGKIYKNIGLLETGHVISVKPRTDIIAEFIGQTGPRMEDCIRRAMGGILFIDEAYSLYKPDSPRDFGPEAIAVLIDYMESQRGKFVVIMAGYSSDMNILMSSNAGLKSRLSNTIEFSDYSPDELRMIFIKMCEDVGYIISNGVIDKVVSYLENEKVHEGINFGNGRSVRNILEKIEKNQSVRVEKLMKSLPKSKIAEALKTFLPEDVDEFLFKDGTGYRRKIGF